MSACSCILITEKYLVEILLNCRHVYSAYLLVIAQCISDVYFWRLFWKPEAVAFHSDRNTVPAHVTSSTAHPSDTAIIHYSKMASLVWLTAALSHTASQEAVSRLSASNWPCPSQETKKPAPWLRVLWVCTSSQCPRSHIGLGCCHLADTLCNDKTQGWLFHSLRVQHLDIYVQTKKWKIIGNRTPKQK